MGMAASQVRFLSLQNRKNTIGLNLMTLSNRKMALSRDMNRVSTEYNNAMNQKVFKWSNDSGITYQDINYDLMMKPNVHNMTLPYIVTDAQGRVVLDDNKIEIDGHTTNVSYRDLATMISAYSGVEDDETTYKNTSNLTDNTLNAASIKNLGGSAGSDATSGLASEKAYQIVSSATQMPQNSLRYDLMEKLGLITPGEKQEIKNKELEIYGSTDNINGPYPVGSLMGNYYIACAHLQAYEELLRNGDYTFAAVTTGVDTTRSNTRVAPTIDNFGTIEYKNDVTNSGSNISFDGNVSYFKQVDLTQQYNPSTGEVSAISSNSGSLNAYCSYEINGGSITYNYGTPTMLALMGTCDVAVPANENKYKFMQVAGSTVIGRNWADLYQSNAIISLYTRTGDRDNHKLEKDRVNTGLTNLVNEMANDFKNQQAIVIDQNALDKARQSTIAFFKGDITNNSDYPCKKFGANNHTGKIINDANNKANTYNLVGVAIRNGSWIQGTDDYVTANINFKNLYNTFITFYDYYYHQPNVEAITTGAPVTVPAEESYTPIDTTGVTYDNSTKESLTYGATNYVRIKGSELSESGETLTFYDYYLSDGAGNKTGNVIQRDYVTEDGYYREYYDDTNNGRNAKAYTINEMLYNLTYKNQINTGTNPENLETTESTVGAADHKLELSYINREGTEVKYTLHNEISKSTYATTIDGDVIDTTQDLKQAVAEALAAKEAALQELDKLFAEKECKVMDYFDALFKMISEKGWVYDSKVNDKSKPQDSKNYFSAMLENNLYFITEVDTLDGTDFNYATKLATNVSKIFQVYDTDAQNVALSKYESEKAEINTKEKQLDIRMNKLEAEQDAIKTELDSIKKVIDDNVSNTFKIFT